jgi:hypothetical protein
VAETVTLPDALAPTAGAVIATTGTVLLLEGALLLAPIKPAHPVLKNAKLTTPASASACLVPNSTAPLKIRKAFIDLLKLFKSFLFKAGETPKGATTYIRRVVRLGEPGGARYCSEGANWCRCVEQVRNCPDGHQEMGIFPTSGFFFENLVFLIIRAPWVLLRH